MQFEQFGGRHQHLPAMVIIRLKRFLLKLIAQLVAEKSCARSLKVVGIEIKPKHDCF